MNDAEKSMLESTRGGGGGKTPYISHIGMCRPQGFGFLPFWSENGCKFFSGIDYGFRGNNGSV